MVAAGYILSTLLGSGLRKGQHPIGHFENDLNTAPETGNIPYTLPTERTFLLNVPETYKHGEAYPLVLSFHGGEFESAPPSYTLAHAH